MGVKGSGDTELLQACAPGRVLGEGSQLFHGACGDELAWAVVVGGSQPGGIDGCQHLVAVPADDGSHRGGGDRGGRCHAPATFPDEHQGRLCGDHPGQGSGCELSDGVSGEQVGSIAGAKRKDLLEGGYS